MLNIIQNLMSKPVATSTSELKLREIPPSLLAKEVKFDTRGQPISGLNSSSSNSSSSQTGAKETQEVSKVQVKSSDSKDVVGAGQQTSKNQGTESGSKFVESNAKYGSTALRSALLTDDVAEKIRLLDISRRHFSNALYGARGLVSMKEVEEYSWKVKEIELMARELGVTGEIKSGMKNMLAKLKNAAVIRGDEIRSEKLKVIPGYIEQSAKIDVESDVPNAFVKFQPDTEVEITYQQLNDNLIDSRKVYPVKPLMMPWNNRKGFQYSGPTVLGSVDTVMYSFLRANGLQSELVPCLNSVYCNGTIKGLSNRMITKLISSSQAKNTMTYDAAFCRKVNKFFFYDRALLAKMSEVKVGEELSSGCDSMEFINAKSCAGFPYAFEQGNGTLPQVSGITRLPYDYTSNPVVDIHGVQGVALLPLEQAVPILDHALYSANKVVNSFKGKTLSEVMGMWKSIVDKDPCLNTFLLKRKAEVIAREEYYEKVRPYGAQPLPMRLVCKHAVFPFEGSLKNFLEDPVSISAYRYSPFCGGSKKLVQHFVKGAVPGKKPKMVGISYGDDQLFLIVFPDGSLVLWGPDVSAMDMSTSGKMAENFARFNATCYSDVSTDRRILLAIANYMAFTHFIHIGKTYVVMKENSLISGIPGTTFYNIFTSAGMRVVMEDELDKCGDCLTSKDFEKLRLRLEEGVRKAFGFQFKQVEGNICYYESVRVLETTGLRVPFLSAVVVPEGSGFVSVPIDVNKFSNSLVLSGCFKKTNELRLNIILGVYFSGAWYNDLWRSTLKACFKHFYNAGVVDGFVEPEVEDGLVCMFREMGATYSWGLPSREYMVDFHQLSRDELSVKWGSKWNNDEPLNKKSGIVVAKVPTAREDQKLAKVIITEAKSEGATSSANGGGNDARNQLMAANSVINSKSGEVQDALKRAVENGAVRHQIVGPYPSAPPAAASTLFDDHLVRGVDAGNPTANNAMQAKEKQQRYLTRRALKNKLRDEMRAAIRLAANNTLSVKFEKFMKDYDSDEDVNEPVAKDLDRQDQQDESAWSDKQLDQNIEDREDEWRDKERKNREFVESDEFAKVFGYVG